MPVAVPCAPGARATCDTRSVCVACVATRRLKRETAQSYTVGIPANWPGSASAVAWRAQTNEIPPLISVARAESTAAPRATRRCTRRRLERRQLSTAVAPRPRAAPDTVAQPRPSRRTATITAVRAPAGADRRDAPLAYRNSNHRNATTCVSTAPCCPSTSGWRSRDAPPGAMRP